MLRLHPLSRLASGIFLIFGAIIAHEPASMGLIYPVVFGGIVITSLVRPHLRFLVLVTLPLLVALVAIWGLVVPTTQGGQDGVTFAFITWLRIVVCGGVIQWLLLPLVEKPTYFRAFLHRLHVPPAMGTLLITPILFLPEVKRRIEHIVDARKAQGLPATGFAGLGALPSMVVPLIASLIESALARAELWTHRGLLNRRSDVAQELTYAPIHSLVVVVVAAGTVLISGSLQWI